MKTKLTQKEKILAMLKLRQHSAVELNKIAFRYSARIEELRNQGHNIETIREKNSKGKYKPYCSYKLIEAK